jgi:hypothetical protein
MRLRETFSHAEVAFIVGVPLACGVLLLFHPTSGDTLYELASSDTTAWLVFYGASRSSSGSARACSSIRAHPTTS